MKRLLWTALLAPLCMMAAEPGGSRAEFGFEQRIRTENWNNAMDFNGRTDDEREQMRYRTRVWANLPFSSSVDFYVGLTQETTQKMGKVNQFDEIIFDSMYLDFKRLPVRGLSLRVGRQMFTRGEGFIMFDGTSGDGSRTQYFNGFDLAWQAGKTKIEAIGAINPARDRMLPVWHNQRKLMQNWDEQTIGTYVTSDMFRRTHLEGYYFYKKETRDRTAKTSPLYQPDRHVQTAGGRVVRELNKQWSVTGELARQWGAQHGGRNISGWGGYGYVKRVFDHPMKPYVKGGYWALSGDDPNTSTIEGWDPIFSRWPKWSELFVYSQVRETGVAYWTNMNLWQLEAGFRPAPQWSGRVTYYRMGAFQPLTGSAYANGRHRGNMWQAYAEYQITPYLKSHAIIERMGPGSFYATRNPAYFLRFELLCQLRGHLPGARATDKARP